MNLCPICQTELVNMFPYTNNQDLSDFQSLLKNIYTCPNRKLDIDNMFNHYIARIDNTDYLYKIIEVYPYGVEIIKNENHEHTKISFIYPPEDLRKARTKELLHLDSATDWVFSGMDEFLKKVKTYLLFS